jgi:hemerythrin superfamily protein
MRTLTELASKAVGLAKGASATLSGYRGIFRTLKREHGEVSVLLMRVATDRDGEARAQLFPVIVRELLSHAQAEDAEFYTVLADHESTRGMVMELEADHERIEMLIGELASMPMNSSAWLVRFRELQHAVQEHVDQEENQVFPRARHILSPEMAEEIDHRYRIEKARGAVPLVDVDEIIPPPEPPGRHPGL